jgi:hypothetical protein
LPTGILPKSFVESATPVNAPKGESKRESPRLASVNPNLYLIPGIAATQVPNKRLDDANKNPTANAGFSLMKDEMFLIIAKQGQEYEPYKTYKSGKLRYPVWLKTIALVDRT